MRRRQFEGVYYPKYRDIITALARKLAGSDDDLVQDLEQEGAVALFKLDVKRASKNEDAWIRQALKFRMVDYLRRYDPAHYESLDQRFLCGDQLEQTDDGEVVLRTSRPRPMKMHETEDTGNDAG